MSSALIRIHESQFPDRVRRDLLESLRARKVNHKFHYDSIKQTQKWLALHQAYSPSRHDADCAAMYDRSFKAAAAMISTNRVHLIGLGCGGGQKDARLLKELKAREKKLFYTPCDVSGAMVLVAREAALAEIPDQDCFPFVCDLASAGDLPLAFAQQDLPSATRLISFFGMIPNFEPQAILPQLTRLVGENDHLLFSANLAPGSDYRAGVEKVFPQYDNPQTRDWLLTFLLDLGIESRDGELRFEIEPDEAGLGLLRVVARFHFLRRCEIAIESNRFKFDVAESIRLFFSYRYSPDLIEKTLRQYGLVIAEKWIAASEEEGVFWIKPARGQKR